MRTGGRRVAAVALCLLAGAGISPAYYHFIRYNTRTGPFTPIYEKFDLNALPNKTVTYFISAQAQLQLAPNDSYSGVVSQIRAAAKVWNDVGTSDLRLSYGGTITPGTPGSAPFVEIVFDEVPPGLIAWGTPQILADYNGAFVPVVKSIVTIRNDLSLKPSYGGSLFGTLVHELGHALGLQHTLTSSAMSTSITRATSRSKPLAADDVAGISILYPSRTFFTSTGSISGRVTLNGQGVNLASVVAISPSGPAISALTNPDGTYRIDGLSPRQYLVYVHPLPPTQFGETHPANIFPPLDPDRREIAPTLNFDTQFFPGTKDAQQAFPLAVTAGAGTDGINFTVRARTPVQIHSVQTYAFPGNFTVKPPYLNPAIPRPFIVAGGAGLVANSAPANGLTVGVLGGVNLPVKPYSQAPESYLQMDVDVRSFLAADSPRHLVFSFNNDIYVLPSGFFQVQNQPPSITSVTPSFDPSGARTVAVAGTNLTGDTKIYFDGIPAVFRSLDDSGRIVVTPPPAPTGYRANVVAVNLDGQDSAFLQGDTAPVFAYGDASVAAPSDATAASVNANPASLPAGTDALVEITGVNTNFVDGQSVAGFGSSDIVVRRAWVTGPNRILVNVSVNPNAGPITTVLSVTSGLQVVSQPFGFQAQAASNRIISLSSQVINAATGLPVVNAGNTAIVTVLATPSPLSSSALVLFWNDRQLPIASVSGNQLTFQIPADAISGQNALRVDTNGQRGLAIGVSVDPAPPQINAVSSIFNQPVDAARPAHPGDLLNVQMIGLADPGSLVAGSRVTANVGGIDFPVNQIAAVGAAHQVLLFLPQNVPLGTQVPLTISIDGRVSAPALLTIRSN